MISLDKYKGKKIAVFGLGKTGNGAVRALSNSGAEVYAWDDNENSRKTLAELNLNNVRIADYYNYDWKNIEFLLLSPGVPLTHPKPHEIVIAAEKNNCKIICDIELLNLAVPEARYIAITGTNGKSTTTALIGHILKEAGITVQVGGNIGNSVLELENLSRDGVYVLETSSYQLDLLDKARFNIAVFTNVTPDHLDRHGDMAGYIKAKMNIFNNQTKDDFAIIAIDDDYTKKIYAELPKEGIRKVIPVSNSMQPKNGVYMEAVQLFDNLDLGAPKEFNIGELEYLKGKHNWQNIVAAYAAARSLGVLPEKIISAIKSFKGLKHRIEFVAEIDGVKFYNDSKATNAEATEKALLSFNEIYWVAGGLAKTGGIGALEPLFSRVKHSFLIGKAEDEFAATLEGKAEYTKCGNLAAATEKAWVMAKEDLIKNKVKSPVVLLSPAAASFDQWKSFEERGEKFCEQVREIKKNAAR